MGSCPEGTEGFSPAFRVPFSGRFCLFCSPQTPIEGAVLNGFGNMYDLNFSCADEIGDRSRNLQDTVIGSCAEVQGCDGGTEQIHAFGIEVAVFAKEPRCHPRVAADFGLVAESLQLDESGVRNTLPDVRGGFLRRDFGEVF